ncbi:hypothetical protein BBI11_14320 [Planococcus maritimus]|nr:hypothetical protein BBI11_14320 [Planococcus maritimus]
MGASPRKASDKLRKIRLYHFLDSPKAYSNTLYAFLLPINPSDFESMTKKGFLYLITENYGILNDIKFEFRNVQEAPL